MTPGNWPITIIQGQTKLVKVTWTNKDLTGCTVRYLAKNSPVDGDLELSLTDANSGITWVSRTPSGCFQINFTPSITANLTEGSGDHLVWVDFPDGSKFPLLSGSYQIRKG
jgi:hypothetical protein